MFNASKRRKFRKLRPLLIMAPIVGIGAYLVYSRTKTAKAPAYDPQWQWPEAPLTPAGAISPHPIEATIASEPLARKEDLAVSSRAEALLRKQIVDLNGDVIGQSEAIYYRSLSGEPEWLATSIGLVDPKRVLVPLEGATVEDEIKLAQAKGLVQDAPVIEEQVLDEASEMALYGYYGVRRTLPGVESERNEENLRLRMWIPAESVPEVDG